MVKLKGITVTLVDTVEIGRDPFNNPIYEEQEIEVEDVLVAPTSSDDVVNEMSLSGRKAVYTLAIPKGDTHDWEEKEVLFFGKHWKAFGIPLEGMDHLIPLRWNKKVMVERYE